jgi:hypothetical protein
MVVIVNCTHNVAQYALYRVEVLSGGAQHELAHVADDKGDVRPSVHQIPEAANQESILNGVDQWSSTDYMGV